MTAIADRALTAADVSRETAERLASYCQLVRKWSPAINLISRSDLEHLEQRHILDSLQLSHFLPKTKANWTDIGSGGGLPGIVLAIVAKEKSPEVSFQLIESDQRKAAFLRTAARTLELNVKVHASRSEDLEPLNANIVSARALGSLDMLLRHTSRHLGPNGRGLFMKGRTHDEEITEASQKWSFEVERFVSLTDDAARILLISDLHHV